MGSGFDDWIYCQFLQLLPIITARNQSSAEPFFLDRRRPLFILLLVLRLTANKSKSKSKSKSYCDWRSVNQYVLVSSPTWGSWPDIYYSLAATVLFLWGALSDERSGLSFVYAAGHRQRSLSRVLYYYIGVFTLSLHRNGCSSIVACVFVAARTCLATRCVAMNIHITVFPLDSIIA
jgi:hypothetical protein